jgi:hypothetical protein
MDLHMPEFFRLTKRNCVHPVLGTPNTKQKSAEEEVRQQRAGGLLARTYTKVCPSSLLHKPSAVPL